jgi:hypothetical protein
MLVPYKRFSYKGRVCVDPSACMLKQIDLTYTTLPPARVHILFSEWGISIIRSSQNR